MRVMSVFMSSDMSQYHTFVIYRHTFVIYIYTFVISANLLTDRTVTSSSAAAAFSAAAPKLWNTLPDHLRASCSFPVFKSGLKTHLFRQAFDSCHVIYTDETTVSDYLLYL